MGIAGITNQNAGSGNSQVSRDMLRRGAVTPDKLSIRVRNATGGTLAVNTLVYINGYNAANQCPTIAKADADVAGAPALYICAASFGNNRNGYVYRQMMSAANLNTNGATVGDKVYLDTTAGGWTLTAPVAPSRQQVVGRVVVVSATVGKIAFDLQSEPAAGTASVDIPAGSVDPAAMGIAVWNGSGGAMAANDLVYISGYDAASDKPKIAKADSDAAGKRAQYVCIGAIADAAAGRVYKRFASAADQNTNAAGAAGDPVYLSTTAGGYVIAAPAAGVRKQIVGHVKVKSATVGVVVFDLESTNDELFGTTELAAEAVTNTKMPAGVLSADATGRALFADDIFTSTEVSTVGAGGKFAADCITAGGADHLFAADAIGEDLLTANELTGRVVANGAAANVIGAIPVRHIYSIGDAAGNTDIVLTHKTEITDIEVIKTAGAGGAGDTVQLFNGASAISNAMSLNVADQAVVRAGTIDDAQNVVAAAGTLRVTIVDGNAGATDLSCRVIVTGHRSA